MKNKFMDLRTGVIGVGSMGQNHARIYSEVSNLVAVADSNEVHGREVAERFGVTWYRNYREMLDEVDAVTIAVPTALHREAVESVAISGVHLLVEKPLAGNTADAKAIVDVAKSAGITLAVGHIERHNEVVKHAKKCIETGVWGNILTITARRFSSFPERIHDVGVLFDLTIHDVDVISYLIGEKVSEVFTVGGQAKNKNHEDHVILSMKFKNGLIGLCETNWLTPMKVRDLSITTDKCFVTLDFIQQEIKILTTQYTNLNPSNLFETELKISEENISLGKIEPLRNEILDFLESVNNDREPLVTGNQGLRAVQIVEAGLESLTKNSVVKL